MRWHGLLHKIDAIQILVGYVRTWTVEQVAGMAAQEASHAATGCKKLFVCDCSGGGKKGLRVAAVDDSNCP
ncbi:hypothetical protein IP65_16520 [Novosphingobium sp. AAP1]|nr:hypothetical protein IP65_16520 [Novosphingobium sp. AAP1]